MENIKFIDITQLPEEAFLNIKNLIAIDSNGEVIKAQKQDSYTKDEIDDLIKDAEISADKLQNKIKIDSARTDYVVTQPTVSGDSIVLTDSMSDKNQYHTFGYDKTIITTSNKLLDYSTPLFRGTNEYNCPQWDGNSIRFQFISGMNFKARLTIPYAYNGVKYVTHFEIDIRNQMYTLNFGVISDKNFVGYQAVKFKESEVYKAFGANGTFVFKTNNTIKDYAVLETNSTSDFIFYGNIEMSIGNFPLSNGALIIETPRFYLYSNNVLMGDVPTVSQSSDHPERLNDYIRYANDVKAYILTDKNTTFKTINGEQILGNGNIEISTDVDLSNLATKEELSTKQDTLVSGTNIKSINGTSLLSSGNMELATKEELNTKQDVISDLDTIRSGAALGATALQSVPSEYATEQWVNEQGFLKEHQDISNLATKAELATKQDVISDLETIRSGAALGATALQSVPSEYATEQWVNEQGFLKEHQDISNLATKEELSTKQDVINDLDAIRSGAALGATALQSVPSEYALKSEIPDISTKQDKLVSGENIKTVNGASLLGSGNIVIEASADNVPTLQTTKQGTTSNYIYSSGKNDYYGVISNISNGITYSTDKASIETYKYYWGSTSTNVYSYCTLNAATTSQAGLMSASDKTKLDGIDLTTKQDTLVSGTNIKTINGTSLLGSGNISIDTNVDLSNYATKSELNAKQDVINDLDTIRSGAALGATALQSVPDTYALKSDIPDITTKQDKLISGTNIKTVNGTSLLGSGNIEVAKEWVGTQAEYNALTEKDNNTTYYITE